MICPSFSKCFLPVFVTHFVYIHLIKTNSFDIKATEHQCCASRFLTAEKLARTYKHIFILHFVKTRAHVWIHTSFTMTRSLHIGEHDAITGVVFYQNS